MKKYKFASFIVLMVFIGCASLTFGPGEKPNAVAPKIQINADNSKTWDRPGAFGPVPAKMQATGKIACGPKMKAIGYHPKAQDANGNAFPGGGYLCEPMK